MDLGLYEALIVSSMLFLMISGLKLFGKAREKYTNQDINEVVKNVKTERIPISEAELAAILSELKKANKQ